MLAQLNFLGELVHGPNVPEKVPPTCQRFAAPRYLAGHRFRSFAPPCLASGGHGWLLMSLRRNRHG